ncbi:hypothetical protein MTR67_046876, partial [Solanum verrucosum]
SLQKGLTIALTYNLTPLEINVDCQDILHCLANDHPSYSNSLADCRELLLKLGNPLVQHKYREENQVADTLAKEGSRLKEANSLILWTTPPLIVSSRIEADKVGTLFVRLKKSSSTIEGINVYNVNPTPFPNVTSHTQPFTCTNYNISSCLPKKKTY